jgi:hypothetical protein
VESRGISNLTAERKRGMNNKDRPHPTKKEKGAKARVNKLIKLRKAKASIIPTTTECIPWPCTAIALQQYN